MGKFHSAGTIVGILVAVLLVQAGLLLGAGHLAVNGHEVDVLHATQAAMRLVAGQAQHIDFVSPLGILSFAPVAMFVSAGFDISTAFLASNLLVALLLLPVLIWVILTRLRGLVGVLFGVVVLIMVNAVVYGGDQATVSMSMYYNRWAWAAVFLIVPLMILPSLDADRPLIDGAIIGGLLGVLALAKMTFFITLAPVVLIVLLIGRRFPALIACGVAGGLVGVIATIWLGFGHWTAYLNDMAFVAASTVRPQPGLDIADILAAPAFLPGSICLLVTVIGLRKCGLEVAGLVLLLLMPAFVYITFQNWGNDPKWLILLGFLAWAWRDLSEGEILGGSSQVFMTAVAVACFAITGPTLINMSMSPLRNFFATPSDYIRVMDAPEHAGLMIERDRSFSASGLRPIQAIRDPEGDEAEELLRLGGFELPGCELQSGYFGAVSAIARDLKAGGYAEARLAFVDVTNPLALVGGFPMTPSGSPWYYGGTREADVADFVVVPKCPISDVTFSAYIEDLNGSEAAWSLVEEMDHAWVFTQR